MLKKKFGVLLLAVSVLVSLIVPVHGADIGVKSPYKGIDVSKYQGTIDWAKVKQAGVRFAMIRTGVGGDPGYWDAQTDPYFAQNYKGAKQSGIKVGVYHVCYAKNTTMASQEADECLHILNGRSLDYPVAYDIEPLKNQDGSDYWSGVTPEKFGTIVKTFCEKIRKAGYRVMVYSCVDFYNNHLTSSLVSQYNTWIAHYTDDPTPRFSDYTMWQYSSTGNVNGITGSVDGSVDLDYYYPTFRSDTSSYTFGKRTDYTYKITTDDYAVPKAVSSNPASVAVSAARSTTDGYLFTIYNYGTGSAKITTTSGDGTMSASFWATGNNFAKIHSDTPLSFTLKQGASYQYKFTGAPGFRYNFVSANNAVFRKASVYQSGGSYYFKIYGVAPGCAGLYASAPGGWGQRVGIVTVSAPKPVSKAIRSDTPLHFTLKQGAYYQYKFTGAPGFQYNFVSANNAVFRKASVYQSGGSYYFKIYGVAPGCAGLYASTSGWAGRVGIVTVSAPKPVSKAIRSDTPLHFTLKQGAYYQYKFTGAPGFQYNFVSANNAVFRKASVYQSGGSYYFKIYGVAPGCAGLYASTSGWAGRVGIVTVSAPKPVSKEVRSDTPYYFNMKKGTYYQYKFTGAPGVQYSFACANNAVFRKASVYQSGGSYYFKIYAAGKGCAGLYASAPGWGKRVGIVTVS